MTEPRHFTGAGVSDGAAAGALYLADTRARSDATAEEVANAFAEVAADRSALSRRLRRDGRAGAAEIIEISAMIAADSALVEPAVAAVRAGIDATTAVRQAAEAQAAVLAALDSPEFAERAGDVRQIGQAVIEQLSGGPAAPPASGFILVRREVAAVDLVELAERGLVGAASVAGGASSHAAIVARGLGVPMVTGVDPGMLDLQTGRPAVIDADAGELIVDPPGAVLAAVTSRRPAAGRHPGGRLAPRTADNAEITVLCNVASTTETRLGLDAGAAGAGLVRTEIPFLDANAWPTRAEHTAELAPVLQLLAGRLATVRLLDFSGDKIPPFLRGCPATGLAALLENPAAVTAQLEAALTCGKGANLAVLIPMVSSPAQADIVRGLLAGVAARSGSGVPRLGIMVELAGTAAAAEDFTGVADFFSIGTNDLTGQVLGLDRRDPAAAPNRAADPRVLRLIGHVIDVAAAAGLPVSVCGDAAADPLMLPLLIGLGLRTVSVPAARVDRVRAAVTGLSAAHCRAVAAQALAARSPAQVTELVQRAGVS